MCVSVGGRRFGSDDDDVDRTRFIPSHAHHVRIGRSARHQEVLLTPAPKEKRQEEPRETHESRRTGPSRRSRHRRRTIRASVRGQRCVHARDKKGTEREAEASRGHGKRTHAPTRDKQGKNGTDLQVQAIRHGDTSLPASLNATDDEVPCDGSTEAKRERVRRNRRHPRARASDQTQLEDESDGTKGTRGTPILHVSDRVKRRSKGNPPTPIGRHPSKGNVRTKPTWKALARRMGQDDDEEEMEGRENERRTGTRERKANWDEKRPETRAS
eukprot:scaffold1235_cov300-Pavlova_lutheri.AAC.3